MNLVANNTKNDNMASDFIYSSIAIRELSKDYRICIKFPSIEYQVQSKQIQIMKVLSNDEISEYINSAFYNWDEILLKQFQCHSKF